MSAQPSIPVPQPGHTHPQASLYDVNPYEILVEARVASRQMLEAHDRMMAHLAAVDEPAQLEEVILTAAQPTWESRERFQKPTLSVGLYNPNPITVYFNGIGSASSTARSPSAPPNSLIVLPISAAMIEVGAAPADVAAGNAVCFLLRYFTVQPAFLGKGA